jgi:16S rRNA (uracil1498-N3)-methyltransferase
MKQFLLPDGYIGEATTRITGKDYHYLRHVLRLGIGDKLCGIDREGRSYLLTIEKEEREAFMVNSKPEDSGAPLFPFSINLYQCVPKGNRMDLIVRQGTEIGVQRIVPLFSERTVKKPDEREGWERRIDRWNRITKEALQQSGARFAPTIERPGPLDALEKRERGCDLFFCPDSEGQSLHRLLAGPPRAVNILIGPEGGFSEKEIAYILGLGFSAASLGETVLRVETAALCAAAAVKILLLESKIWKTA